MLKTFQRHIEERGLLNAALRARHSMTLHFMKFTDYVALNFNNNIPMAVVFLDIEKAIDTTWHLGLLYKLYNLKFLVSLINLISSLLSQRKFEVSVEGEVTAQMDIQAGVPQGSIPSQHCTVNTYI
jgi:hypothetical protein